MGVVVELVEEGRRRHSISSLSANLWYLVLCSRFDHCVFVCAA